MKVTDADRQLVQDLAESFDLKLDPRQQRLLAIILASHRLSGAVPVQERCTSALQTLDAGIVVCSERGPHTVHGHDGTTWVRTCGARYPKDPWIVCGLEPHAEGTVHSSGAVAWPA